MAGKVPSTYHGIVYTEIVGGAEAANAINDMAKRLPIVFRQAVAAEAVNLKKSIAATLKNYQVLKAVPVPNLTEVQKWNGYKLAKKGRITKILRSKNPVSHLAKPGSVSVQSIPGGFRIGHFGDLGKYAVRFQDGVPRQLGRDRKSQLWKLYRLKEAGVVTGGEGSVEFTLASVLAEESPQRQYIGVLAEKCGRDFIPGLKRCFEKIREGAFKKAQVKTTKK